MRRPIVRALARRARADARLAVIGALSALLGLATVIHGQSPRNAREGGGGPNAPSVLVRRVATIGMTVSDMDRAVGFWHDVLTFAKVRDEELWGADVEALTGVFGARIRVVDMRLGTETVRLTEYLAPRGRPIPADARSNDLTFQHVAIVVSDMKAAYARLRSYRVPHVSTAPQRLPDWNPNAGGIEAFYFRDPDGHTLELISFPPGKGDPRWRGRHDTLFLGVDHTAIAVHSTEASLAFYRDALGLRVAGASENWGTEQEHLNNVFGAHLRITALRAGRGPGIELLEYLTPRDGRPAPGDEHANDLTHWETTLVVSDADSAARRLRDARAPFVSPAAVQLTTDKLSFDRGELVRDPDGHVLAIVQP